jgi:hypothetical protein
VFNEKSEPTSWPDWSAVRTRAKYAVRGSTAVRFPEHGEPGIRTSHPLPHNLNEKRRTFQRGLPPGETLLAPGESQYGDCAATYSLVSFYNRTKLIALLVASYDPAPPRPAKAGSKMRTTVNNGSEACDEGVPDCSGGDAVGAVRAESSISARPDIARFGRSAWTSMRPVGRPIRVRTNSPDHLVRARVMS